MAVTVQLCGGELGKSGSRQKKSATANGTVSNPATTAVHPAPPTPIAPAATANGTDGSGDPSVFLKRALELKDEGNARFQAKDYAAAMELYNQALKLTPRSHPEHAVFHSNRAAQILFRATQIWCYMVANFPEEGWWDSCTLSCYLFGNTREQLQTKHLRKSQMIASHREKMYGAGGHGPDHKSDDPPKKFAG